MTAISDFSLLKRVRWIGFLEGVSFLILLAVAMPLKYWANLPQAVQITGLVHGILFVYYFIVVTQGKMEYRWKWPQVLLMWLAALVPCGTFYTDYQYLRHRAESSQ
jgi:integral membrane protein